MKVVILCGGKGTRIREETGYRPKPMITIGEKPILWHIMKHYSTYGFREFILCLGYKQEVIREYFLNYQYMINDCTIHLGSNDHIMFHGQHDHNEDWDVTLVDTGLETKKGTRIKKIERFIDEDEFMLTYGDGVSNIDLKALTAYHQKHNKKVTFTGVHPISRFATVEENDKGQIVDWSEKKQLEGYVNAGYFVLHKDVFQYLNDDCEFEEGPMKKIAKEKQVAMYKHEQFWHCMDTYRDYTFLQQLWHSGQAPWKIW